MNPIILYDNILNRGTLTVTDQAEGFAKENLLDMRTYTKWRAGGSGTKYITIELSSAEDVDCFAIAGHNLKTAAATITLEYYNNTHSEFEALSSEIVIADNNVLIKSLTNTSTAKFRLKIVTAAVAPEIAVLYIGKAILFDYPPEAPVIPYSESISNKLEISEEGHDLGNITAFKPISINQTFKDVTRTFISTYIIPFWQNHGSLGKKFFYAWDLVNAPADMFYCKLSESYKFETPASIANYFDSFTLDMKAEK